jgi:Ni2+-binding GTPase involved in maturation of urease and hydrogenase
LPEFVFSDVVKPEEMFSMSIVGSRKSGKTTYLFNEFPTWEAKFDLIVVFSNSIQADAYDFVRNKPKVLLFDDYNSGIIGYLERF